MLPLPALADQNVIPNYNSARDTYFYDQLYPGGGWTLYCGARFEDRTGLNVEHVYAASWMKVTASCPETMSRTDCRRTSPRFNRMEADLHNLYPALANINQARSNHLFGMIEGEACQRPCPWSCPDSLRQSQTNVIRAFVLTPVDPSSMPWPKSEHTFQPVRFM